MQFKTFSTFIVAAWLMAAVRSVDGKKKSVHCQQQRCSCFHCHHSSAGIDLIDLSVSVMNNDQQ